ncbi:MAG: PfkB family carbohydrate kinase [Myxococcales bacterium]|nr:PfkB family carbohydrate kinase [Myxococcales bacterium]MDH3485831.1 PfkB family carbohydrate kinase [Myxococcales bacterium]
MSSLLVVGSVAFDTIHNHLGSHARILGGSATYASLAASQLAPVRLIGVVGKDFPREAVDMLRGRGIDTTGLEVANGDTFHWEGRYAEDLTSRTTIQTDLNVFADFEPKIPEPFRDSEFVMLGNIAPELQLHVLDQVRSPRLVIADTMNLWIDTALAALKELLSRVDILVINEEEARQLSGYHHPLAVAEALRALGPETVIVKRGEYGALLFLEEDIFCAPAYPLKTVADPTGAGDSFAGGFLGYLAQAGHDDLRQAVICGSAAASFCVQDVGIGALENLSREDIEDRIHEFRELTTF